MSLEELASASGLDRRALDELSRFGLLVGRKMGGDTFYDGDALVVARAAAGFVQFGIEARHLRMYKVAAEREAGFIEQVVMPLLKQRNPTARRQAAENLGEMARLGETLPGRLLLVARASAGGQRVDVEREGVLTALGVGLGDVLVVARPARPALVLVVAVSSQPVAHPVEERGQAVAVPLLERVAGLGQAGAPALVGQDRDLVDQVGVQWASSSG